jgi:hypothetical protein
MSSSFCFERGGRHIRPACTVVVRGRPGAHNATNCKKVAQNVEIAEWLAARELRGLSGNIPYTGNNLKEFPIIFKRILKFSLTIPLCRDTR